MAYRLLHGQISVECVVLSFALALTACGSMPNPRPTNTPLPLPTPTLIVFTRPRATATLAPTESPTSSSAPSATFIPTATETRSVVVAGGLGAPAPATEGASRAEAPAAIQAALRSANIDARVYWFTFGAEEMLMIQYASPLVNRPGYAEMLSTVKTVAAANFLNIDPPLYTLYIAATDLTGTSDTVVRLRRETVERRARSEIGDAELYNNGFEPARLVMTCTQTACTAVQPTPYPTFPPFPFPLPTPSP